MSALIRIAAGAAIAGTVMGAFALAQTSPAIEAARKEICAEAESRYRQIFGKAPSEEPFVVVLMYRDNFCPQQLSVKQGTTVRWVNVDRRTSHSVWFKEAGRAESERTFPEEIVEMVIDWPPGEYPYLCGPHWEREGMVGRLTVTAK